MATQANTCNKIHCMHASHTHPLTPSPLSPPQLPYSWVGSALSCIIMAQILPLFWPLLAFLPASASVKCHVSADSVFWASMSIIRHTTLWKPVDPLLTDTLINVLCVWFSALFLPFSPHIPKHNLISKSLCVCWAVSFPLGHICCLKNKLLFYFLPLSLPLPLSLSASSFSSYSSSLAFFLTLSWKKSQYYM